MNGLSNSVYADQKVRVQSQAILIIFYSRNYLYKGCEYDLTKQVFYNLNQEESRSLDIENIFNAKLYNVWIVMLKLDYFIKIFYRNEKKEITTARIEKKKTNVKT